MIQQSHSWGCIQEIWELSFEKTHAPQCSQQQDMEATHVPINRGMDKDTADTHTHTHTHTVNVAEPQRHSTWNHDICSNMDGTYWIIRVEKNKHYLHMEAKNSTIGLIHTTKTGSQTQKIRLWLPKGKGEGEGEVTSMRLTDTQSHA